MTATNKRVYAVVVTYNGASWIAKCLQSLQEGCCPISVILVDNASTDETTILAKQFGEVTCVELRRNVGFGRANNIGIRLALNHGAEYVFLLNQDAFVYADTVGSLVDAARAHPEYGIVSPIHLNAEGSGLDEKFARYMVRHRVNPTTEELDYKDSGKELYSVSFVNAAAWLVSSQCLNHAGGFDPIFFMYGEDNDLCNRVLFHGFRIGVMPGTFIRHMRRNGSGEAEPRVSIDRRTNQLLPLYLSNLKRPGTAMARELIRNLGHSQKRVFKALRRREYRDGIAYMGVWLKVFPRLPKVVKHKHICSKPGSHWLFEGSDQGI